MNQIMKRLEIIKSSIAIEDEELITSQVIKLKEFDDEEDIKEIINLLENANFLEALNKIEHYLASKSAVRVYVDKELQSLKLELKALESQLQKLTEEKNEYLNTINDFNIQYNIQVGKIIKGILELKQKIKEKKLKEKFSDLENFKNRYENGQSELKEYEKKLNDLKNKIENTDVLDDEYDRLLDELKDLKSQYKQKEKEVEQNKDKYQEYEKEIEEDIDTQEYEDIKREYEEFNKEYEDFLSKEGNELSKEEEEKLKLIYRKAVRLCHPDIVQEELKEKATQFMQLLNEAYGKKDLKQVKKLYIQLENGAGFHAASDSINNKEILKSKIKELRSATESLKEELKEIKSDEVYKIATEIEDFSQYFKSLKNDLLKEKERLENDFNGAIEDVKIEKEPIFEETHRDINKEFWESEF